MGSSADCVFCRIVVGQIPCLKVFEDDTGLAFLDIGPLAEGHLLWIPREHYARLEDLPAEPAGRFLRVLPQLARALLTVTGADAYNLLANSGSAAGQVVMHVHFHLIPRRGGDGLGYRWAAGKYEEGRGEELARQLRLALSGEPRSGG